MNGVPIRTAEYGDPRFSRAQIQAIEAVVKADPAARLLGLDFAHRPVISAKLGIPREERVYAIQRNGDPTDVKRSGPTGGNLMEAWSEGRGSVYKSGDRAATSA